MTKVLSQFSRFLFLRLFCQRQSKYGWNERTFVQQQLNRSANALTMKVSGMRKEWSVRGSAWLDWRKSRPQEWASSNGMSRFLYCSFVLRLNGSWCCWKLFQSRGSCGKSEKSTNSWKFSRRLELTLLADPCQQFDSAICAPTTTKLRERERVEREVACTQRSFAFFLSYLCTICKDCKKPSEDLTLHRSTESLRGSDRTSDPRQKVALSRYQRRKCNWQRKLRLIPTSPSRIPWKLLKVR